MSDRPSPGDDSGSGNGNEKILSQQGRLDLVERPQMLQGVPVGQIQDASPAVVEEFARNQEPFSPNRRGTWSGVGLPQYASRQQHQLIEGQQPQFQIRRIGLEVVGRDMPDAQIGFGLLN